METQQKKEKTTKKTKNLIRELRIAYRNLENKKKFYRTVLFPLIILSILLFCLPFIIRLFISQNLSLNPITFIIGGILPLVLGILYPYIAWKNKETGINSNMHFFITHLRVLAISDLSLKGIINMIGENKAYGDLGTEIKKIGILTTQWRYPMTKTFHFISERTPSKILTDFLDRFSQSLDSGVDHREFIEAEQEAVLQEYKTIYETSNENIVILNEVYVSMLIAIIFVMSFGIVLPIILGAESMNTYTYLSSFMLLATEGLLLYLLKSMIPPDHIWHQTGERGDIEEKLRKYLRFSIIGSILLGFLLFLSKYYFSFPFISLIPFEILIALAITPLLYPGIKTYLEEENITRKEKNFFAFLQSLGSIATMKGGKINESVYYLSKKDYGVLSKYIRSLYKRLRLRIDDDATWQWFGVDTGSNFIQRSSEMFREATSAAGNPRSVARMISFNMRRILDLRFKKFSIINTSMALFAGITFGISFAIYTSLVISQHLNDIVIQTGDPFNEIQSINIGSLLHLVPPIVYSTLFIIIFFVLFFHSLIISYTIRMMRGSHAYLTLLYFVPFIWIVAITSAAVTVFIGGLL
ncbi:type II secretion system F family protein [Pseudomonadota bacterium]